MANIAALLKSEISRIARKEIKSQTEAVAKASRTARREIAELKRRLLVLERELKATQKVAARTSTQAAAASDAASDGEAGSSVRFSAKGLVSLRKRLDLSAADFGRLVGASGLSIYKWEQGKAKPRARYLAALADLRGIGKKEAARRLEVAE